MDSLRETVNQSKIGPDCVICEQAEIKGEVTIGSGTIVHPKARIIAEAGPIIIGDGNLIEERSLIWNKLQDDSTATPIMIIGNGNVFEVCCESSALKVGDGNVFEPKSIVGREVVVTNGCTIGAGCQLLGTEVLPNQVTISGSNCQRAITASQGSQALQMETLAKTLPLYNAIAKRPRITGKS